MSIKICPHCKSDNIVMRPYESSFYMNGYKYDCNNCHAVLEEKCLLDKPVVQINFSYSLPSSNELSCGCTDYFDRGFSGCS